MTAQINPVIHANEIAEIVESVFGTMLDLQVFRWAEPWLPDKDRITSSVHLTGDWCGAVLLECTRSQARRFCSRFLAAGEMRPEDCEYGTSGGLDDVARDVLGELANMIGGNLKCVLTRGTRLSMPSVVDGDYSLRICGGAIQERLAFRCDEGVFWITVVTTALRKDMAQDHLIRGQAASLRETLNGAKLTLG